MKLDKIAFAKVLVYIAGIVQRNNLDSTDVEVLDNMIDIEVNQTEKVYASADSIERMLCAMQNDRRIEAIKEHRAMTGMGLKESKDVIEKYWPKKGYTAADLRSKLNINVWNTARYEVIEEFIQSLNS